MDKTTVERFAAGLPANIFGLAEGTRFAVRCTPLLGGLHHLNYKIVIDGNDETAFVARLAATPHHAATLRNEHWYISQLGMGIAPEVVYSNDETPLGPLVISRFYAGSHKVVAKLADNEIRRLAAKLRAVHGITSHRFSVGDAEKPSRTGTFRDYARLNVAVNIDDAYQLAKSVRHDEQLVTAARSLLGELLSDPDPAWEGDVFSLCHGDIGDGNLLWTADDVRLIDWDGANFGDPANEIAYIFAINNTDDHFQSVFLEAYLDGAADKEGMLQRLPAYVLRNRLFDTVWAIGKVHEATAGGSLIKTPVEECWAMYEERRRNLQVYLDSLREPSLKT